MFDWPYKHDGFQYSLSGMYDLVLYAKTNDHAPYLPYRISFNKLLD